MSSRSRWTRKTWMWLNRTWRHWVMVPDKYFLQFGFREMRPAGGLLLSCQPSASTEMDDYETNTTLSHTHKHNSDIETQARHSRFILKYENQNCWSEDLQGTTVCWISSYRDSIWYFYRTAFGFWHWQLKDVKTLNRTFRHRQKMFRSIFIGLRKHGGQISCEAARKEKVLCIQPEGKWGKKMFLELILTDIHLKSFTQKLRLFRRTSSPKIEFIQMLTNHLYETKGSSPFGKCQNLVSFM